MTPNFFLDHNATNNYSTLFLFISLIGIFLIIGILLLLIARFFIKKETTESQTKRWHYVYYVLAAFDIITVSISLRINHDLIKRYEEAALLASEWSARQKKIIELSIVSTAMNAPGNDVFQSKNPQKERENFEKIYDNFTAKLAQLQKENDKKIAEEFSMNFLHIHDSFKKIKEQTDSYHIIVENIFSAFEQKKEAEAAKYMAEMDRLFSVNANEFSSLVLHIFRINNQLSLQNIEHSYELRKQELVIFALMIFMVAASTFYGRSIAAKVKADELQKEKDSEELKKHRDNLQQLVEEQTKDITEQKERAERASKAKSDFLANVTHELRTPLNGLIGMANLLKDCKLAEKERAMLDVILQSSQLLCDNVNDILDISKIESGEIKLENVGFDVESVIHRIISVQQSLAAKKNINLSVVLSRRFPFFLVGDSMRLGQVAMNLVNNAVKYTLQGRVTLHVSYHMLDNDNLELNCRVVDTGIGIPANKINSIFEKFSQVDSSNTRQFGGTGLGLAIVKQLVEIMNGSIGVESALGEGSTFWFKIPFLITNELGGENVPNHKNRTKVSLNTIDALDAKILVAEDHPLNQAFMKMLLPKYNLTNFDICENGHEILQSLKQKEYDLILMDCFMPELDGYETTKIIRENEKSSGKHIPIVALTANAMIGDSEKCIAAGMDDYIAKPIAEESLVEILSQWIALPDICSINFQSPKTSEQAPVDLTTLRTITNGDVAMDRKLLALFVTKSNENLAILSEKCIDGECQEWTESAHMLKGGAASIGAEALKILCNEAQNLDNATSNDRYALYENIRNEYSAVCEYLRKNNLIE